MSAKTNRPGAELPPVAWWHRAGVSIVALATVGVLLATWLLIGLAGRPLAFGGEGLALALLLTMIVLSLAATASVIVWRARAGRAAELLAWFMCALAWGAVWNFFKLDSIQDRFLEAWLVKSAAVLAADVPLADFLRSAARRMTILDESAHLALMAAPTLFLLFSEQFPRPLESRHLLQSPLRRFVQPPGWAKGMRVTEHLRWRELGGPEVQIVFSVACIGLAIAFGASVSFDTGPLVVALMFLATGLGIGAATVWAVRRIEGGTQPWAIERWLTAGEDLRQPCLPLSSVLMLLLLAFLYDGLRGQLPDLQGQGPDHAFNARLMFAGLFAPVLQLRIRAVRAVSKPVFWAGWAALVVGASPGLLTAYSFTSNPLGRETVAMACWTLVCSLAATVNFAASYAAADDAGKRRIDWLLAGIFLSSALMLAIIVYAGVCSIPGLRCNAPTTVVRWGVFAPAGALVVCMLVAVFYRGAIDSRLALRRSVTYVLVGLVVTLVFTGAEILLDHVLSSVSGPDVSKWVAASITFLIINPTKHACEKIAVRGTNLILRLISLA